MTNEIKDTRIENCHRISPPYVATKRILIPKSFHAVLAHHHVSIGLAAAKEEEGVRAQKYLFSPVTPASDLCMSLMCLERACQDSCWKQYGQIFFPPSPSNGSALPLSFSSEQALDPTDSVNIYCTTPPESVENVNTKFGMVFIST